MIMFKKLIDPTYLFSINSVMLTRSDKMLFAAGLVMAILGILFKIAALFALNPVDRIVREKFYRLFVSIGISEIIWFGCREINVRFFGTHFIALLILLIGAIWGIRLLVSLFKNYRSDKTAWEKEQVKQKYLPH